MADDFEKLGLEALPRDQVDITDDAPKGWFKFEKVGDGVAGEILDMFYIPEKEKMGAQRAFTLKQPDGKTINVGHKYNTYMCARTDNLEVGDLLGLKFEKEIPTDLSPAKSISVQTKMKDGPRTGQTAAVLASPSGSVMSEVDKQFDDLGDGKIPDSDPLKDEINADDIPI